MRLLLALLALAGCGNAPDQPVCARWNRVVANGVLIPPGVVDRLTVGCAGSLLREVGGTVTHGDWEEDGAIVTLIYPTMTWTGSVTKTRLCPTAPGFCMILAGEGVRDVYQAY